MASSPASSHNAPASWEQHMTCTICLNMFDDPVTTPCGHSFCKSCLNRNSILNEPNCPLCKQFLQRNPEVNISLRSLTEELKKNQKQGSACAGEVACDICQGRKLKAKKSCLVCLVSYCETHLKPHCSTSRLKGHRLVEPVVNLDDRACLTHGRPLELYRRRDQQCVCALCVEEGQEVVSTELEWERKKAELDDTKRELQQKIESREGKVDEIKASEKACLDQLLNEYWAVEEVFVKVDNAMEKAKERAQQPLQERMDTLKREARELTEELQREIHKLRETISELDNISALEDNILFLQTYPSLSDLSDGRDWTEVGVDTSVSFSTMQTITTTMIKEMEQALEKLAAVELQRISMFAVDVKLDPDTAHVHLILSDDGKEVRDEGMIQEVPNGPERFDFHSSVLGLSKLSSGKSYWEVEVGNKPGWDLGVSSGANRKGRLSMIPSEGYWATVHYDTEQYAALTDPPTRLSLKEKPQRVGVFVDYEEGLVSFYNVNARSHIYSFTGYSFTDGLYPYFSPHFRQDERNSDPLIISPVTLV